MHICWGLIGRSHFPAQTQEEESEERRWLDCDRGNTLLKSSAKKDSRITEISGKSYISNRKSKGPMTLGDATKTGSLHRKDAVDLDLV